MAKEKPHINLVVIGHVDSGKSTSTGHLVYLCGGVDQRTLEKYRSESAKLDKASFCFAWITDKLQQERTRGTSINWSMTRIYSADETTPDVQIIDAPGHRDYVKNMLTGATMADHALLLVSAVAAECEAGVGVGGQTKEHLLLAFTLGVKHLVVFVNKMDEESVKYSEKQYEAVCFKISELVKSIGFDLEKVRFLPGSGWIGDNLVSKSSNLPWYTGPTLLDALRSLPVPVRPSEKPLRIPIHHIYSISGVGTVASGMVHTGVIRQGMILKFSPGKIVEGCRQLEIHHEIQRYQDVGPGQYVGINLRLDKSWLHRGQIISNLNQLPAAEVFEFLAMIVVLNHPGKIRTGYTPIVHCHAAHVACRFEEIKSKVDKSSGKTIEENPAFLVNGDSAIVKLVPIKPMVVETYQEFAPLGRLAIRDLRQTVAVGIIKQITKKQ